MGDFPWFVAFYGTVILKRSSAAVTVIIPTMVAFYGVATVIFFVAAQLTIGRRYLAVTIAFAINIIFTDWP